MSLVVARQLSKLYSAGSQLVRAVDEVSLTIEPAERIALIGRSGSGKTTLLNILAGLDRPTSGELLVANQSLHQLRRRELADYRARAIGVVYQSFQLIAGRTALENVELPLMLQGQSRRERRRVAMTALERVGLAERVDHRPNELSGGEQQRVAIARAIVHRPQLILADEPSGNLDSATAGIVMRLLLEVAQEHSAALFLITHDLPLAERMSERVLHLSDGRLIEEAA